MQESIVKRLKAVTLGTPQALRNVVVLPITNGSAEGGVHYITLAEALESHLLTVSEVSQGGSVPELSVNNAGEVAVLLLDGEELAGAKQNRVLNTTVLVPAKQSILNRVKSQAAPLKHCAFLGFQIGTRCKAVWTAKAHARFKQRVREITRRNRGHRVQDVIDELRRYVVGWLKYFGLSDTYTALLALEEWVRRRVRLYYWKQWKQPRTRRRHLLALGIPREEVHMATRSRKGYWRMSANSIVQRALTNRWLQEQGVPDMRTLWITLHYGPKARI